MSTTTQTAWSTPYLAYFPNHGADCLEFLQVPGTGRLNARHFLDFCARKNDLMDLASDAKKIIVAIDPMLVEEASYIVNNLLCAVIGAERNKITLQPTSGAGRMITIYFFEGESPVLHRPKASAAKKSHSHHARPHHKPHPTIHVF